MLIVGVNTLNGVPQAPFEGFEPPAREEFALTVENICRQNIYPPLLPRTTVVPSDVANRIFLVIEVEESGEAPHAIENSRKVYVRTGSAANPYDLADVDLIIDLVKRRKAPLALRDRLLASAELRSHQVVRHDLPFVQISICPAFPRTPLSSSQEVWDFLIPLTVRGSYLVPPNSMRRVPDGTASIVPPTGLRSSGQYAEVSRFGLLFGTRQFTLINWNDQIQDARQQLHFADLFQLLSRLAVCAGSFYAARGYRGNLQLSASLHHVQGQAMRFVALDRYAGPDDPDNFRCIADNVSAERLATVEQIQSPGAEVLTDILTELTWAFWQSPHEHPNGGLRQNLQILIGQRRA